MRRALVLLFFTVVSCNDPVRSGWEKAVPDDPVHEDGPAHHQGYQCTACHTGGQLRGPTDFSFAGTIFKLRDDASADLDQRAFDGARVIITDRSGATRTLTTNAAGNFYIARSEYDPPWPVTILITGPNGETIIDQNGKYVNQMRSHVGREGGCGFCHKLGLRNDPENVPEVYFARNASDFAKARVQP